MTDEQPNMDSVGPASHTELCRLVREYRKNHPNENFYVEPIVHIGNAQFVAFLHRLLKKRR